nr:unnamed protein product [Digitaria exilis]
MVERFSKLIYSPTNSSGPQQPTSIVLETDWTLASSAANSDAGEFEDGASPTLTAMVGPSSRAPQYGVPSPPDTGGPSLLSYRLPHMVLRGTAMPLPLPSPVPWLVLPRGDIISFPHGETFQLPPGVRCHNSCGEWLLLSRDDDSCFLMNPFTKATMPIPSLSSYSYYEEPVEIAEDCLAPENEMQGNWSHNKDTYEMSVLTLVVCSTHLIAAIVAVGDLGTIALCQPGASAWSVNAHEDCRWLSHMVFFQGKLYALDSNTDVEDLISIDIVDEHDSDKPRVSRIERVIEGRSLPSQVGQMSYMQESISRNLWGQNKRTLRRFNVEGLVLPVLLLIREAARKAKRNLHAVVCSYRKKAVMNSDALWISLAQSCMKAMPGLLPDSCF